MERIVLTSTDHRIALARVYSETYAALIDRSLSVDVAMKYAKEAVHDFESLFK